MREGVDERIFCFGESTRKCWGIFLFKCVRLWCMTSVGRVCYCGEAQSNSLVGNSHPHEEGQPKKTKSMRSQRAHIRSARGGMWLFSILFRDVQKTGIFPPESTAEVLVVITGQGINSDKINDT